MKIETYKGRKLRVVRGRGPLFGYAKVTLNGVPMGKHLGDEDAALRWLRGAIDAVDTDGVNGNRYGAPWYAPGTFELCDGLVSHPKEIGGQCRHSTCIRDRAV